MSATKFDTQDYLKDLARRHPEVVELEQVEGKNNLTPPPPLLHPYPHRILHPHRHSKWDPDRITQTLSHRHHAHPHHQKVGFEPRGSGNLDGEDWQGSSRRTHTEVSQ